MSRIGKKIFLYCFLIIQGMSAFSMAQGVNFGSVLDRIFDDTIESADSDVGLSKRIQYIGITNNVSDGSEIRDFLIDIAQKVLIPIFIFAGVIIAIIGFYKLLVSSSDEALKEAREYILRGLIGIIIMVSAGYIVNKLAGGDGNGGIFHGGILESTKSGAEMASEMYTSIIFPFLQIAMYLVLGVLFILLVIHVFKYVFSDGDEIQKKSISIMVYATLGILVIILAKSLVESVYGKYSEVTASGIDNLGQVGTGIFHTLNFDVVYSAINRILGLVSFIVLIMIIYQGYMLMTSPHDEEMIKKLKTTLLYIFVGILVIGAGYLLVNFFVIT